MAMNSRMLIGRVGRDAEIKSLQNGAKVCSFSVAQDRGWYDKNTNAWKPAVKWYNCSIWNDAADRAYNRIKKGMLFIGVGVEDGRAYINNAGEAALSLDFKVETYKVFVTVKSEYSDDGEPQERDPYDMSEDDDIAF